MIYFAKILLTLLATNSGSDYRQKFPLPSQIVPSGWGVNIHFTDAGPGEMQKLAAAGFKWIRMDFGWDRIEKSKGHYDFTAYDRLMASLRDVSIRPLFIFDYGNDLYDKGAPSTQAGRDAFCRFVKASITHFKAQGIVWEMWNEPNISFWQPKPDVEEYVALAKAVGKTIRQVAPQEWYIGPGVSTFDWSFLQRCIDAGMLEYWDAVSTHPYRGSEPETVIEDWTRLRRMIDSKVPKGRSVGMISSEWGYTDVASGIGIQRQALFLCRQYLINLMCGAPLSIAYDWKNDGTDPNDGEQHFGTVTHDLTPKPAYKEIQRVSQALAGYAFRMRLAQDSKADFVLAFQKGQSVKYVGWTTSRQIHQADLHLGADSAKSWLTETPLIWDAKDPSLLISCRHLPMSFDIQDRRRTQAFVSDLLARFDWTRLNDRKARVRLSGTDLEAWVTRKTSEKLARMLTDKLDSHWTATPLTLTFSVVTKSGATFAQTVECTQSKPVSVGIIKAKGQVWASIHNPGKRSMVLSTLHSSKPKKTLASFPIWFEDEFISIASEKERLMDPSVKITLTRNNKPLLPVGSSPDLDYVPAFTEPGFIPMSLDRFSKDSSGHLDDSRVSFTQDGDAKVGLAMDAKVTVASDGPLQGAEAVQINYQFQPGWKFIELHARGDMAKPLVGEPECLNMLVKGNASGDALRMRFVDATGQTFQPTFGNIDWKGWKFVPFNLNHDSAGNWGGTWGGAADGVVHYPIRLDTLALIDSQRKSGMPQSVTIAGITLIRRK